MNRIVYLSAILMFLCLAGVWLPAFSSSASPIVAKATLTIPSGLTAFPGDTLVVPIFVTTAESIGMAQMVIEFDQQDFTFVAAALGPDAAGFAEPLINLSPPFPVSTPGATGNLLLQISGAGMHSFTGSDRNVLVLRFKVSGKSGGSSPFAFNPSPAATFLTTTGLAALQGADLQFNNGSGNISSLATLNIPGGFRVPQAETLHVAVRLSSAIKPIGVAQIVLDYDGKDIQFLNATPGPDAPGFAILVDPAPRFTPETAGTNKNVLVSLYSGSGAISGADKTVLIVSFLAIGQVGGNSPIAFDRRPQHTVLATTDLVDLTASDLTFRDGDATIRPPLVTVRGNVFYKPSGLPVSGAVVTLSGPVNAVDTTDEAGRYSLKKIQQGSYTLRPAKTGDTHNAIQGSDVLVVLRVVALIDTLNADQKRSADVTRDGFVTASDALAILRYLAFQTTGIAHVGTWIFEPESVSLLVQIDTTQNFTAFLLGDVNGNWSQVGGLAKTPELPFATLQWGELREDGENVYLPLLAGQEGRVFTLLATLELPYNVGKEVRFVPVATHILSATHFDAAQKWHLALATIAGIAPQEKIGELVMSRAVAVSLRSWQVERAEINDWPVQVNALQLGAVENVIPATFVLQPNYPNPFNAATWIAFGIPVSAGETEVRVDLFTTDGKLVRSLAPGKLVPGMHRILWDGRDAAGASVPSGVYFYRIHGGGFTASRKLTVIK